MNCNALESRIALYIEGDLPVSDRTKLETHLQGCVVCSKVAEDLRRSQTLFKALRKETVKASDLAGVRVRVLNEVGDLEPAPGWVLTVHRLFFAGLRRRSAIAGVLLAALVSGSVWYSQKPVLREVKLNLNREVTDAAPVEVARLEVPDVLISPVLVPSSPVASRIAKPAALPESLIAPVPGTQGDLAFIEPISAEGQSSPIPPMKFVTDDPNIIIYWLPTDTGD